MNSCYWYILGTSCLTWRRHEPERSFLGLTPDLVVEWRFRFCASGSRWILVPRRSHRLPITARSSTCDQPAREAKMTCSLASPRERDGSRELQGHNSYSNLSLGA